MAGVGMNVWNALDAFPDGTRAGLRDDRQFRRRPSGASGDSGERDQRGAIAGRRRRLLISFDPHPLAVVAPSRGPKLLQTRRQKLEAIEATGRRRDAALAVRPRAGRAHRRGVLRGLSRRAHPIRRGPRGEQFPLRPRPRGRHPAARDDRSQARILGPGRPACEHRRRDGRPRRPSAPRSTRETSPGRRAMLGRPFAVTGEVVRGEGRGRLLDFPTANVAVDNETIPARGVYVTGDAGVRLALPVDHERRRAARPSAAPRSPSSPT